MRMSRLLVRTLREAPADAEVASHQLLVRAGLHPAAGLGGLHLPPSRAAGAAPRWSRSSARSSTPPAARSCCLPALHPIELWEQSGRAALFGSDALPAMTVDARGGTFVLGPTHEEVVTVTVGAEVDSYRQLPLTVYQIQVKFRDEARPRFGLLRTRELIMADAYSFDVDKEAMQASYRKVFDAYLRIFARSASTPPRWRRQSGAIGGDVNHEFMVPSAVGEDHFVSCPSCGYAANVEAATRATRGTDSRPAAIPTSAPVVVEHHTPDRPGIADVVAFFADQAVTAADLLKSMAVFDADGRPTLLLVPGDREARLPAAGGCSRTPTSRPIPSLIKGYIGPTGPAGADGIRVVADLTAWPGPGRWITGANQSGPPRHRGGPRPRLHRRRVGLVRPGGGGRRLPALRRGGRAGPSVEAAHTFQLGTQVLRGHARCSNFVAEDGGEAIFSMGCYGMGVSRLLAVVAEEHHDDRGLAWPPEAAPTGCTSAALGAGRSPEVAEAADGLYRRS